MITEWLERPMSNVSYSFVDPTVWEDAILSLKDMASTINNINQLFPEEIITWEDMMKQKKEE